MANAGEKDGGNDEGAAQDACKKEENKNGEFDNRHLRFIFVAFLFSAAIRDVGDGIVRVFTDAGSNIAAPAALTHLILTFFVITMSWVGWAANIGRGPKLKDIFSGQYPLLLLDVVLVFLYIALAKTAELPSEQVPAPVADAVPESFLLAVVYSLYLAWDFFHDVRERRADGISKHPSVAPPTLLQSADAVRVRCGASFTSVCLALGIAWFAWKWQVHSVKSVCLLNGAEIANAVLFRALKQHEAGFESRLHQFYQEVEDRYKDKRCRMQCWEYSMFVAYALFGLAAILLS